MSFSKFLMFFTVCVVIILSRNVAAEGKSKGSAAEQNQSVNDEEVERSFQDIVETIWRASIARSIVYVTPRAPTQSFGSNYFCAGVVVSAKFVLTAAECLVGYQTDFHSSKTIQRPRKIVIVAGWPYRLSYEPELTKRIRAKRIIVNIDYLLHKYHNLGLIELEESLPVEGTDIKIAPMPVAPPKPGDVCTLMSWGRLYWNGPLSDMQKRMDLTLKSSEECSNRSSKYRAECNICALDDVNHKLTPCPGDMGAPLFCSGVLQGINVVTENCKNRVDPVSLFSSIYHNRKWIENTINGMRSGPHASSSVLLFLTVLCFWV